MKALGKWVVAASAITLLAGCFGNKDTGGSDPNLNPLNINEVNLAGAWQLESVTIQGQTRPASFESRAGNNGYRGSVEIRQIQIEGNKISDVIADELMVHSLKTTTFTLQGQTLLTARNGYSDFLILALTGSTLKLQEISKGTRPPSPVQELNFRRINPQELAWNLLKPSTLNFKYKLIAGRTVVEDSFSGTFPWGKNEIPTNVTCEYSAGTGRLKVSYVRYKRSRMSEQPLIHDAHITIVGAGRFNFNSPNENVMMMLPGVKQGSDSPLYGLISSRGQGLTISSARETNCQMQVQRQNRNLSLNGVCSGLRVGTSYDRPEKGIQLQFSAQCLLTF